jgi:hypothetical protein
VKGKYDLLVEVRFSVRGIFVACQRLRTKSSRGVTPTTQTDQFPFVSATKLQDPGGCRRSTATGPHRPGEDMPHVVTPALRTEVGPPHAGDAGLARSCSMSRLGTASPVHRERLQSSRTCETACPAPRTSAPAHCTTTFGCTNLAPPQLAHSSHFRHPGSSSGSTRTPPGHRTLASPARRQEQSASSGARRTRTSLALRIPSA